MPIDGPQQTGYHAQRVTLFIDSWPRLATYGINSTHTTELVEKAAKASSMKANPIALTGEELGAILELG